MSIDDEHGLRGQLTAEIERYSPGPAQVGEVVWQGRRLRSRRRAASVMAAVCVIAAAAVGITVVLHPASRPAPVSSRHYTVTVHEPRPSKPLPVNIGSNRSVSGLIAYGRANNRRWWLRLSERAGMLDITAPQVQDSSGAGCGCVTRRTYSGAPVTLVDTGGSPDVVYGVVRADVTYLRVRLTNGQTLVVRPVALFGRRYSAYVAFGLPFVSAVTRIAAYSARGELTYAIPFARYGTLQIQWLPAGTAATGRASYLIGSGTYDGATWSERLDKGPWGTCQVVTWPRRGLPPGTLHAEPDVRCPLTPLRAGQLAQMPVGDVDNLFTTPGPATGSQLVQGVELAQAQPQVSYLVLTRSNGSTTRVPAVLIRGRSYFTFVTSLYFPGPVKRIPPRAVIRWTAYNSAGHKLGSGSAFFRPGL